MKSQDQQISDILELTKQLPSGCSEEHTQRIQHTMKHGHILTFERDGRVTDYAELYRLNAIPSYPVKPWPKDDPRGRILYCFAAVSKNIRSLIRSAKEKFSGCNYIVWHRHKKRNRVYVNRIGVRHV